MTTTDVGGPLIFYDTNALGYIADGRVVNFLPLLSTHGARHVVSEVTLAELPCGVLAKVVQDQSFLYLKSTDQIYLEGLTTFYSRMDIPEASPADYLQNFLEAFLRAISGSPSSVDLDQLFQECLKDLLSELWTDLPPGADPRLIDQLSGARDQVLRALKEIPRAGQLFQQKDLKRIRNGPKVMGNISAPRVIETICKLQPDLAVWLGQLAKPIEAGQEIKARIRELCVALVSAGFSRDPDIVNADVSKSERGARAQFRDFDHICCAAPCNAFVTADKRCARLAYSVYEALGISTSVLLLIPNSEQELVRLVGEEYWP